MVYTAEFHGKIIVAKIDQQLAKLLREENVTLSTHNSQLAEFSSQRVQLMATHSIGVFIQRRGVAVTSLGVSTKLLYVRPG